MFCPKCGCSNFKEITIDGMNAKNFAKASGVVATTGMLGSIIPGIGTAIGLSIGAYMSQKYILNETKKLQCEKCGFIVQEDMTKS
jgi:predicted nucleic-acid-binding Zn-ribbon protein